MKRLIAFLGLALLSGLAAAAEPTEQDMRSAIQQQINRRYQNATALEQECKRMRESQNPYVAIGCLMGKTQKMANISITSFEKIGCEKARAVPGYRCDYRVRLSTGGLLGPLDNMGGGINTKRFVNTSSGWELTD